MRPPPRYLIVASRADPVAEQLWEQWGRRAPTEFRVDGAPLREVAPGVLGLRRSELHIFDDGLDARLPPELRDARIPLIYPSVHRSEAGLRALTVHPLGNFGPRAEVGGRPETLVPTAPRIMTAALRRLAEESPSLGIPATFEATHHGPYLDQPAFFVEVGVTEGEVPPSPVVRALSRVLESLEPDERDRIAIGVGGGHYVPHFSQLALLRRWAFGHLLSRHVLDHLNRPRVQEAWEKSAGAEGWIFARSGDAARDLWSGLGVRLRDSEAPRRAEGEGSPSSG